MHYVCYTTRMYVHYVQNIRKYETWIVNFITIFIMAILLAKTQTYCKLGVGGIDKYPIMVFKIKILRYN